MILDCRLLLLLSGGEGFSEILVALKLSGQFDHPLNFQHLLLLVVAAVLGLALLVLKHRRLLLSIFLCSLALCVAVLSILGRL